MQNALKRTHSQTHANQRKRSSAFDAWEIFALKRDLEFLGCRSTIYRAPLVQISMSVQSTMVIVSIHAITLEAVSHVAVDLATDWIVMVDHAQVRKIKTHLLLLILTLLCLFHQISTNVQKTVTTVNSCVVIMLVASHVVVDWGTYYHLMGEAALVSSASTDEYVM